MSCSTNPEGGYRLNLKPWFSLPSPPRHRPHHAAVIGAGLAGTAVAQALAKRGWKITLLERHTTLACEASGNSTGLLMPLLEAGSSPSQRWFTVAYRYALAHLAGLGHAVEWSPWGILWAAWNPRILRRQRTLLERLSSFPWPIRSVDAQEASLLCGFPVHWQGLYLPQGGWVHPPSLCQAQLAAAGAKVNVIFQREVSALEYHQGEWRLVDSTAHELARAPIVVIASGAEAARLPQTQGLPIQPVRGQITEIEAGSANPRLKTGVCGPGYVIPARNGRYCIGATYDPANFNTAPSPVDQQKNWDSLRQLLPALADHLSDASAWGRVAFRAVSPDHLPLIGPVPDETDFRTVYADLRHGRPCSVYPPAPYHGGLYISSGHGSRGLVSAPLAAELLAALINQEPLPVALDLLQALHPARFLVRRLQRTG